MRPVRVLSIGNTRPYLLDAVCASLARAFHTDCSLLDRKFDPAFAHHPERNQYFSTSILEHMAQNNAHVDILLGVTELDLYIPILTFVFGEAQLGGTCALVSYHRLTQEFYGLPPDPDVLTERLVKEAIHEVGHTAGLTHCEDYECVMAATHAVEWLDLKTSAFCDDCRRAAGLDRPSFGRARSFR
jgi:archaemetzincin